MDSYDSTSFSAEKSKKNFLGQSYCELEILMTYENFDFCNPGDGSRVLSNGNPDL